AYIEPAKNLERSSEVAPNADWTQMYLAVLVDNRDLRALGAEQHRVHRNRNPWNRRSGRKMHLTERTRQQLAVLVGNIHFCVQGARRGIDGIGCANHRSPKFLPGKFL